MAKSSAFYFILLIAVGIASYTEPLYICEIVPKKRRSSLVSLNQLAISVGMMGVSYLIDYSLSSTGNWRTKNIKHNQKPDTLVEKEILSKEATFESIAKLALERNFNLKPSSGKQEHLEEILNRYLF